MKVNIGKITSIEIDEIFAPPIHTMTDIPHSSNYYSKPISIIIKFETEYQMIEGKVLSKLLNKSVVIDLENA